MGDRHHKRTVAPFFHPTRTVQCGCYESSLVTNGGHAVVFAIILLCCSVRVYTLPGPINPTYSTLPFTSSLHIRPGSIQGWIRFSQSSFRFMTCNMLGCSPIYCQSSSDFQCTMTNTSSSPHLTFFARAAI